jgi:hypothetical protein
MFSRGWLAGTIPAIMAYRQSHPMNARLTHHSFEVQRDAVNFGHKPVHDSLQGAPPPVSSPIGMSGSPRQLVCFGGAAMTRRRPGAQELRACAVPESLFARRTRVMAELTL